MELTDRVSDDVLVLHCCDYRRKEQQVRKPILGSLMIPPDNRDSCAFAGLRRADRAVSHLYDLVLAPTRLKATQYTILRSIAEAGEIAHCDLARQALGSEETFSRRLAAARRNEWVQMRFGDRTPHVVSD